MNTWFYILTFFMSNSLFAQAPSYNLDYFRAGKQELKYGKIHVRLYNPDKDPQDVMADYFHLMGLGASVDAHDEYFTLLMNQGIRVVTFDYPGHGESEGDITDYGISELASLATEVERKLRRDQLVGRPLFLGGWSMGGLILIRLLQDTALHFSQTPAGVILYAPRMGTWPLFVGDWGDITPETLTRNREVDYGRGLENPLYAPWFSTSLILNSMKAQKDLLPSNIPLLTFVADSETDFYTDSDEILKWLGKQKRYRHNKVNTSTVAGFFCQGAYHDLLNEPGGISIQVQRTSTQFMKTISRGDFSLSRYDYDPCEVIGSTKPGLH